MSITVNLMVTIRRTLSHPFSCFSIPTRLLQILSETHQNVLHGSPVSSLPPGGYTATALVGKPITVATLYLCRSGQWQTREALSDDCESNSQLKSR